MAANLTTAAAQRLQLKAASLRDRFVLLEAMAEAECSPLPPEQRARLEMSHQLLRTIEGLLELQAASGRA